MNILGISHLLSYNPAACLIQDGKLIAFAEEERFIRQKQAPRAFVRESIKFCLKAGNISLEDVDVVAVGFYNPDDPWTKGKDELLEAELKNLGLKNIRYYDHHLSHAASTAIPSGFEESNVISIDGWGGPSSGLLGYKTGNDIKVLKSIPPTHTWGGIWNRVTKHIGFMGHGEEGKTMGLASYGAPDQFLLPDFTEDNLPNKEKYLDFFSSPKYKAGKIAFGTFEGSALLESIIKINTAATLQDLYQRSLVEIGKKLYEETKCKNFTLAGGVALNCTGNGYLSNQSFVEKIFIQPASHDGGTALGSAILAYRDFEGSWPTIKFDNAYWGREFSDGQIRKCLVRHNAKFEEVDPVEAAIKNISQNNVIGFFQGRSEVGPRALGNRSILADPTKYENLNKVNAIKRREKWRPLAPSILEEEYFNIVECKTLSPFMLMATQVKEKFKIKIPAVTHIDGSCRPQSVSKKANKKYHQILSGLEKAIGVPVVLNTSFNNKGEPIVDSPEDALNSFLNCDLDKLIIGSFEVSK